MSSVSDILAEVKEVYDAMLFYKWLAAVAESDGEYDFWAQVYDAMTAVAAHERSEA